MAYSFYQDVNRSELENMEKSDIIDQIINLQRMYNDLEDDFALNSIDDL